MTNDITEKISFQNIVKIYKQKNITTNNLHPKILAHFIEHSSLFEKVNPDEETPCCLSLAYEFIPSVSANLSSYGLDGFILVFFEDNNIPTLITSNHRIELNIQLDEETLKNVIIKNLEVYFKKSFQPIFIGVLNGYIKKQNYRKNETHSTQSRNLPQES